MIHDLKCWPDYFGDVLDGSKNFEVRKYDRKYAVGDKLVLREWEPSTQSYTGRECHRWIGYLMTGIGNVGVIGPAKGISSGYVVLGLTPYRLDRDDEVNLTFAEKLA